MYKISQPLISRVRPQRQFATFTNILERFLLGRVKSIDPRSKRVPDFDKITDIDIEQNSKIYPDDTYHNKIFWKPRFYQAPYLSPEFLKEVKKFRNIVAWKNEHVLALTQLILIEAIRDTTFDYTFYYEAEPSLASPFHGTIEILLYQKYDDENMGTPYIPILFPIEKKQFTTDLIQEEYSSTRIASVGLWCMNHMRAIDPDWEF